MALDWNRIAKDATPKGWKVATVEPQPDGDVFITWDTGVHDENRFGTVCVGVEDVQREGRKKIGHWLKMQVKGFAEKLAFVRAAGQGDVQNAVHPPDIRAHLDAIAPDIAPKDGSQADGQHDVGQTPPN